MAVFEELRTNNFSAHENLTCFEKKKKKYCSIKKAKPNDLK